MVSRCTTVMAGLIGYSGSLWAVAGEPIDVLKLDAPLKVDGADADWPAKAVALPLLGNDGKASVRLAADKAYLYAFIHVHDASPLKNTAQQPQESLKGGDAISIFLGDEQQRQRVLIASRQGNTEVFAHRPKSEQKRPHTFTSPVGEAKFDFVGPLPSAEAALMASATGYVAEVALPWKSLGYASMPESFPFDVQVIFSDPAGTTNVGSVWLNAVNSPAQTVEDLPTEARLYPETWGVARITAAPSNTRKAIVNTTANVAPGIPIEIDLPADGKVSVVVLDQNGAIVRELMAAADRKAGKLRLEWDGRDRYDEPLPPGAYRWKAIQFDGIHAKFLGSVGASGRPPYRTPDGLGAIGGQHGRPTALASDAGGVYMSNGAEEGQPAMRKIDARTGKALWKRGVGGFGAAMGIAADDDVACFINMVRVSRTERAYDLVRIDPATGKDVNMGSAPARLRLDVPEKAEFGGIAIVGHIAWFSEPNENRIRGVDLRTGQWATERKINNPKGLSRFDDNTLLVCAEDRVVKLNVGSGDVSVVLDKLVEPRHAVVDSSGNLYVSQLGEMQQISKFDRAGKLIAHHGREGGKPRVQKQFDPLALDNVTVLAIGPDQNLWMCESSNAPKRFVRMSLEGKWQEDYYGAVAYNVFGPDLDDFSTVYYNPGGNESAVHFLRTQIDYEAYRANPEDPAAAWKITASYDLTAAADGITTNPLMVNPAQTGYGHVFAFTGPNGKRYLFRTSKANRAKTPEGAGLWIWNNDCWQPAAFLSHDVEKFGKSWSDANADGLPQDGERYGELPTRTFAWIDRNLVLHGFDGTLAPSSINANGVPVYDGGTFTPYFAEGAEDYRVDWTFVSPTADGAVYYTSNVGPGRKMSFWDRADDARVMKVKDGKTEWIIGQQAAKPQHAQFATMSGIAGIVDDVMLVHNVEPSNYVAITTDGLTLGDIMRNENGERPSVGPDVINIESFTGLYAKDPKTGRNVLFAVSSGDDRILEVVGPKRTSRFEGEITLNTSRPRAASDAMIPYQTWYGNSVRELGIDGRTTEWEPQSRGLPLIDNGVLTGDVRLRRDAGSLCVLASVLDRNPFEAGDSLEITLESTGGEKAVAKITIQPDPSAKDRSRLAIRINYNGKDITVANAKAAVAKRWFDLGYRIEAEIPLDTFAGLSITTPQKFRRGEKGNAANREALVMHEETLADLPKSLQLGIRLTQNRDGKNHAITWPANGGTAQVQAP